MLGTFVGRTRELNVLEGAYQSPGSAFIPIYGRRRVGKSELIRQFASDKTCVYHLGKKARPELQCREFLSEAAEVLHEPLLAQVAPTDWKAALSAVAGRHEAGKLVLVLDEFQWTAGASPELPSVLQDLWDRDWVSSGRMLLILCGSYVGFMEREVLGRQSPLFGRRTAQILLRPFGYVEAGDFHPGYSLTDRARAYFVCGGIPLYLRYFDPGRSVEQNLEACLLDESAPLFQEPDFLLREKLRDVENYYAVLWAIASGHTTHQGVAARSGLDTRALSYYLKQLTELGYVSRRFPLTGREPSAKEVRYAVADPFLRFWFRFVYPNMSYLLQRGPRQGLRSRIAPELDAYFGLCFEHLCREALPNLYCNEGIDAAFEVGEYWDRDTQIDVVGLRDDNWTDLGECRWGTVRSARKLAAELDARVARYPNARNATVGRRLFTRSSVPGAEQHAGAKWHTLEELYALARR